MTSRNPRHDRQSRLLEAAFLVGFLALAGAVVAAVTTPATSYEVSIYAATPAAFWLGVAVALVVSILLAVTLDPGPARGLSLLLGGEAVLALVGLPVIRGYRFFGANDALTHLGWVKDLASGVLSPLELFYPGLHTAAVFVGRVAGLGPERALLLVVLATFAVFLLFVPLIVRSLADHPSAVVVGAFAGFLLLPLNAISTHVHAHPFSQTTLLSAMVLFLVIRYVRLPDDRVPSLRPTGIGAMLAVAGIGLVLYHSQQAVNVIVVMVAVSLLQVLWRRRRPASRLAGHRPLYAQTAFLAAVFVAWAFRFNLPFTAIEAIQATVVGYLFGSPPTAASGVQSQASSLTAIGAGLPVMFAKLFLVSAVFWALSAWLVLDLLRGRLDEGPGRTGLVAYLVAGAAALVPLFALYVFGSISEQYFRHWGFLMLILTVLGSVAFVRLLVRVGSPSRHRLAAGGLAVVMAVLVPLSLLTVFPSPYIYQATPHVTDQQMTGYDAVFDHENGDVPLRGVRQGPWRYGDGVMGNADSREYRFSVPEHGLSRLDSLGDGPQYVVVSEYDRQREVGAYRELRYSESGFDSLDSQRSSSRVFSNGDVELYWVDG
jgi:hypothetical protein